MDPSFPTNFSSSEKLLPRIGTPSKLHLSLVFLLLEIFIERRGFQYLDLRDFQVEGILSVIKNQGIFLIAPTASGKSLIAYFFLGNAIVEGYVGVYLVPTTQLLDQTVLDLEEFFQGYVQIFKMSGEHRPTQQELRQHQDSLIIVATYESLRAFLFELQDRKYFTKQKIFGGVVIDEIHYLADEERGPKLESLLYKLQAEHNARLCCMTGTFTLADAQVWSQRLGCKLFYHDPTREFSLKEIIKFDTKKNPTAVEARCARQEKIVKVLKECWEFIVGDNIPNMDLPKIEVRRKKGNWVLEREDPRFKDDSEFSQSEELVPEVQDAKILIFCYSRRFCELIASRINTQFRNFFGQFFLDRQIDEIFSCRYMHAGIARSEQTPIFDQFNKGRGIRILCASPILEEGINVANIQAVMVTDAERCTPTALAQMLGRIREKGTAILFVADEPASVQELKKQLIGCLTICHHFIHTQLLKAGLEYHTHSVPKASGKVLIICPSAELAEFVAIKIGILIKSLYKNQLTEEDYHCDYLHKGLERPHQLAILERFNDQNGFQILCWECSSEDKIDVPRVDMAVLIDLNRLDYVVNYIFRVTAVPWKKVAPSLFLDLRESRSAPDKSLWQMIQEARSAREPEDLAQEWMEDHPCTELLREMSNLLYIIPNLWDYYNREHFYATKVITNKPFSQFKLHPVSDLRVLGFHLNNIPPRVQAEDIPKLTLETMFRHQKTKKQVNTALNPYAGVKYDMELALKKLLVASCIRYNEGKQKKGGHYSTTYIGNATVTMGIDLAVSSRGIKFFQKYDALFRVPWLFNFLDGISYLINNQLPRKDNASKIMNKVDRIYLAHLAKEVVRDEEPWKQDAALKFIKAFETDNLLTNKQLRSKYHISKGDEEMLRRKAIWLATSLYALFISYHMHLRALSGESTQYYQQQPPLFVKKVRNPKKSTDQTPRKAYHYQLDQKIQQCFLRVIQRFQLPAEKGIRKPDHRPHSLFIETSHYAASIRKILRKRKSEGATPQEIQRELEKLQLQSGGLPLASSVSSINSVLTRTMKQELYRQKDNIVVAHRPRYRYWLNRYKPDPRDSPKCKDCGYLVKDPTKRATETDPLTYCTKKQILRGGKLHACSEFRSLTKTRFHITVFDMELNEKDEIRAIRCPQCQHWGTLLLPTFQYLTICTYCKTLYWQTKRKQYMGHAGVYIPENRITSLNGLPVINLSRKPRRIILERYRSLIITKRRKAKLPTIDIYYHNQFRQMFFFEEVELVIVAGGKLSVGDQTVLETHGIAVERYAPEQIARIEAREKEANKLRQKLLTLDEYSLQEKAQDHLIAKIKSNIAYSLEFGKKTLPFELALDQALRQFDYMFHLFFEIKEIENVSILGDLLIILLGFQWGLEPPPKSSAHASAAIINKLRSYEGNAEKAIWKLVIYALPAGLEFKGRQAHRFVKTSIYYGAKAFDPYNAALNYLYFRLYLKVTEMLGAAGFSPLWPGPGLLHQRRDRRHNPQRDSSKPTREPTRTRKNREFIFDFMDAYRPPFRHYLVQAFRDATLDPGEFKWGYDEWKRKVFYISGEVRDQLNHLFEVIWERKFLYQKRGWSIPRKLPLKAIMLIDALDFQRFLSRKYQRHTPFHAYEDLEIKEFVEFFYKILCYILEYKAPGKSAPAKVAPPARINEKPTPELPQNVIIVTHNDWDGFASALFLLLKYYAYRPNVQILVAHNQPARPLFIRNVLKKRVPRLLMKETFNRIIVADFAINWHEGFFIELKQRYEEVLGDFKDRFQISWYDHHSRPRADLRILQERLGMDIHYTLGLDVHRSLWKELYSDFLSLKKAYMSITAISLLFRSVFKEIKPQGKKKSIKFLKPNSLTFSEFLNRSGDKRVLEMFAALPEKGNLEQLIGQNQLDKWYQWFKYTWRQNARRHKNWTHFFEEIVYAAPPPEVSTQQSEEIRPNIGPEHVSLHQTIVGQSFDAIILRYPTLFEHLTDYLSTPQPQVVLSLLPDYTVSVRALDPAIKVIGLLLDQGNIRAHETRGPIYFTRHPLFRLTSSSKVYSSIEYIYGFLFFDELVERLVKSHQFSANPADLFPVEIATIQPQDEVRPDIESFAPVLESQEAIAKLIRKGRKGVLPIEFPRRRILLLPYGTITLFFTQRHNETGLASFLHYLLQRYLLDPSCQETSNPPKVLYIDTTEFTLRLGQLITSSMAKVHLKPFRYLQIDDYPQLIHFITTELKHIILQDNIELIVIQDVFELYDEHLAQETLTRQMYYFKRSQTARTLLVQLTHIAIQTHSCILLTKMNAKTIDDPEYPDLEQIKPALARPFLDYLEEKSQFFFNKTIKTFHLAPKAWKIFDKEGGSRIEYPDGCFKIARPVKVEPAEIEPPTFLQEIISNLKTLEQAPPSPPTIPKPEIAALQPSELEWKDKLLEPPYILKTFYDLVVRVWRFKVHVEDVHPILRSDSTVRHFDLVEWYNKTYNIYNSTIDLSPLKKLGGEERGEGSFKGRGMRFDPNFEGFLAFKKFIQFLHDNPMPLHPL